MEKIKLKMQIILVAFFLLLLPFSKSYGDIFFPIAKITIKATDNESVPIPNADVAFNFDYPKGFGMGSGTATKFVDGKTNTNGEFTITKAAAGKCSFRVSKDGLYDTSKSYHFTEKTLMFTWSPWNPVVEIKLKKIKNPTRMYVKSAGPIKVPILDKPLGYDFEKGDWVMPYGKGIISDFVFVFKIRFTSHDDWDASYKLTFSNADDGIQEYLNSNDYGEFRWPYEAPGDGYKNEINWSAKNYKEGWGMKHKSDYKEDRKYIFRVRTKTDQNGNFVEAKYGRVVGDIEFDGAGYIKFTYYYNPNNNKSLEYDSKNPLLFEGQTKKGK